MSFLGSALIIVVAVAASAQAQPSTNPASPDVSSVPADATRTTSGLVTKVLTAGTGKDHPAKDEIVVVNYTGWTAEGKMFDSSVTRGKPSTLAVDHVLPGLGEGLQLMVAGETRRLWVPAALAFKGQQGKPTGPLVFDVTLIDMPTRAPADVKTPPPDAKRTVSGLSYKVLEPGTGTRHPGTFDEVTVNYTGWTTDGKRFDSSLIRGQPATFPLDRVIPGWTEGMQLMVEGEKARFWIPENLAYQGRKAPYGMLVFDVDLIRIR